MLPLCVNAAQRSRVKMALPGNAPQPLINVSGLARLKLKMNEELQSLITRHRQTAEAAGDLARDAMIRGDIGLARTAARQAAQWARVVMQLETGEQQYEVAEAPQQPEPDSGKMIL